MDMKLPPSIRHSSPVLLCNWRWKLCSCFVYPPPQTPICLYIYISYERSNAPVRLLLWVVLWLLCSWLQVELFYNVLTALLPLSSARIDIHRHSNTTGYLADTSSNGWSHVRHNHCSPVINYLLGVISRYLLTISVINTYTLHVLTWLHLHVFLLLDLRRCTRANLARGRPRVDTPTANHIKYDLRSTYFYASIAKYY